VALRLHNVLKMNSKAVIACALLLILALSCTAADQAPAAPAPEVGADAETLDAEALAASDIEDDLESDDVEQEECVRAARWFALHVCKLVCAASPFMFVFIFGHDVGIDVIWNQV
jgi:hypothetical protein